MNRNETQTGPLPEVTAGYARHVILCGMDKLAFRILEQLCRYGDEVVVIAPDAGDGFRDDMSSLAAIIDGDFREESVLVAAGIERATTLILATDDDLANVHAALAAHEVNPDIRIVLRMFNLEFGRQIQALFQHCIVLSASATAAPAFVAATLFDEDGQRFLLANHTIALRLPAGVGDHVLLPIAQESPGGETILFPKGEGPNTVCLVDEGPAVTPPPSQAWLTRRARVEETPRQAGRTLVRVYAGIDRRLFGLIAIMSVLAVISTLVFHAFGSLSWVDALYFTVTVVTTTGFGDISLLEAPTSLKVFGGLLMITGATGLAVLYALITDTIVRMQFSDSERPFRDLRNHIIVSGLGTVGYRIAEGLTQIGARVAAVEVNADDPFVAEARRLGIPVLVADTRHPSTLTSLHVDRAICLVAATDDDVANLQTALNARSANKGLRIVMRLFDADFAQRVQRTFSIDACHSVSALVAPAFAAAAAGLPVVATIPVGSHILSVTTLDIPATSPLAGRSVGELESLAECRVIHIQSTAETIWQPAATVRIPARSEMSIIGTRAGLAEVAKAAFAVAGPSTQ